MKKFEAPVVEVEVFSVENIMDDYIPGLVCPPEDNQTDWET